jgi:hypothetical protein
MNLFQNPQKSVRDVTESILYDETTFYNQFTHDLEKTQKEVIIESAYITVPRVRKLKTIFDKLAKRGVRIYIITRYPHEHDQVMAEQSEAGIRYFEGLGAQVLLCEGHHRKLAIIDRILLWEGSLNILSQTHSREFMRRFNSKEEAERTFKFLRYNEVSDFKK